MRHFFCLPLLHLISKFKSVLLHLPSLIDGEHMSNILLHLFYKLILTPVQFIPFSGGKGTVFEGGVRVPALIYGPRSLLGNLKSYDGIFHVSDFYPTILNMINETDKLDSRYLKNIDGINCTPVFWPK